MSVSYIKIFNQVVDEFFRELIEIFPEGLGTPTYCMISKSQNIKHYSFFFYFMFDYI